MVTSAPPRGSRTIESLPAQTRADWELAIDNGYDQALRELTGPFPADLRRRLSRRSTP